MGNCTLILLIDANQEATKTVTAKEQKLLKKAKEIWGTKCKECGYSSKLKHTFESEKGYKVIITECPKCGFLFFLGEDGKERWVIREKGK